MSGGRLAGGLEASRGETPVATCSLGARAVLVTRKLLGTDVGQHGAEELVVDDVAGTNASARPLVERPGPQLDAA